MYNFDVFWSLRLLTRLFFFTVQVQGNEEEEYGLITEIIVTKKNWKRGVGSAYQAIRKFSKEQSANYLYIYNEKLFSTSVPHDRSFNASGLMNLRRLMMRQLLW